MLAGSRRCAFLLGLLVWCSSAGVVRGAPAGDGGRPSPRELQAREAFAAGDYPKAVGLFAKLYAETLHPTYLRNVGRCHQNLGDPERAISSFREYLRKGWDPEVVVAVRDKLAVSPPALATTDGGRSLLSWVYLDPTGAAMDPDVYNVFVAFTP